MIGVLSKADEVPVVEEFFQLFKTPWEQYRPGRAYDVVLTTDEEPRGADARLVLVYGSAIRSEDGAASPTPLAHRQPVFVDSRPGRFPLYGEVLTFAKPGLRVVCGAGAEAIGIETRAAGPKVVRIGYDLFQEIAFLLTAGQPAEHGGIPTVELHIGMLRQLILDAGISLLEIPPAPAGHDFAVCLTHDIDFVGIRRHKFDHTMWGFLYRATVGATRDLVRRKLSFTRWIASLKAAASLPLVHLGWLNDFWMLFDWYLRVEKNLSPTYFFIPFKRRPGDKVPAAHPERRASAYDITEIPEWIERLKAEGCEIGVHGIDAWHSAAKGRDELKRVAEVAGRRDLGIRMHWLLRDENTYQLLEEAGYAYDSTAGYNETPGYRCGTTQAFRPLSAKKLLELPMHIQDGALFYPGRLGLSEPAAWSLCETFIDNARQRGGVLTVLWHDRSPGPERFWGDFYVRLVEKLKSLDAWFGTAGQVVAWFRQRRAVTFERVEAEDGSCRIKLCGTGRRTTPALKVRIHSATRDAEDFVWDGETDLEPAALAGTTGSARQEALSVAVPK